MEKISDLLSCSSKLPVNGNPVYEMISLQKLLNFKSPSALDQELRHARIIQINDEKKQDNPSHPVEKVA